MAVPIQSVAMGPSAGQASSGAQKNNQPGSPQRSFDSVLRGTEGNGTSGQKPAASTVSGISGARIEQLRLELMDRTSRIQGDNKKLASMAPDLTDGKTRKGLLQEAMKGLHNPALTGSDMKSLLGEIEDQWLNVERIMTSDKSLSNGELLGLQARLYQVSQHVDVVSKVVDQVTGAIKSILNTNV